MSKIGETESMIQTMEAQFKSAGNAVKEGAAAVQQNGGNTHYEHYEEVREGGGWVREGDGWVREAAWGMNG